MHDVLIVEDSRIQATMMRNRLLGEYPDMRVRTASDPFEARDAVAAHSPDLILLDIDLPKMSGAEFLGHLMRSHPLPVIVVTATLDPHSERAARLLEVGCRRVIQKPRGADDLADFETGLLKAVEEALRCRRGAAPPERAREALLLRSEAQNPPVVAPEKSIIALGASTGGPSALEAVVRQLTPGSPAVVIAQHISVRFAQPLVDTLQSATEMPVQVAICGQRLLPGHVYVTPPSVNTRVVAGLRAQMEEASADCRFTPNIDVLFHSLARLKECQIAAALLTGMGDDGARGLLALRRSGALTIAQDEASCVVYGMPAQAVAIEAANHVLPIDQIGGVLHRWFRATTGARDRSTAASATTP